MWCPRSLAWYNVLDADCIELLSRLPAATDPGGLSVQRLKNGPAPVLVAGPGVLRFLLRGALASARDRLALRHHWRQGHTPPEVAASRCLRSVGRDPTHSGR